MSLVRRKSKKHPVRCVVTGCVNTKVTVKPGLHLFSFPIGWRGMRWASAIHRPGFKISTRSRVCSDHFEEEDFEQDIRPEVLGIQVKRRLVRDAVPSLLLSSPPPNQVETLATLISVKRDCTTEGDSGCRRDNLIDGVCEASDFFGEADCFDDPKTNDDQVATLHEPCLLCSERQGGMMNADEAQKFPGCSGLTALNKELWNTFVLRKVLSLPISKFEEILQKSGGSVNPSAWFTLCLTCGKIVNEIVLVKSQIADLLQRYEKLSNSVQKTLKESFEKENGPVPTGSSASTELLDVRQEIRQFLAYQAGIVIPKVEPFEVLPTSSGMEEESIKLEIAPKRSEKEKRRRQDTGHFIDESDLDNMDSNEVDEEWISEEPPKCRKRKSSGRDSVEEDSSNYEEEHEEESVPISKGKRKKGTRASKSKSRVHKCILCPRKYAKRGLLERHLKLHKETKLSSNGRFDCYICGVPYDKTGSLRLHLKRAHRLTLSRDWDGNSSPDNHVIPVDFKPVREKPKLDVKSSIDKNGKVKLKEQFLCEVCPAKFSNTKGLEVHQEYHKVKENHCPECNFPCRTAENLSWHLRSKHKRSSGSCVCHICGFDARAQHNFKNHMLNHKLFDNSVDKTISETELVCNICRSTFKTRRALSIHKVNAHAKELDIEVFSCPDCPRVYARKDNLEYHVLKAHKNAPTFRCEICGYGAVNRTNLTTHMFKHSGQSVICEYCSGSYSSPHTLRSHIQKQHPDKFHSKKKIFNCKSMSANPESHDHQIPAIEGGFPSVLKEYTCKYCGTVLPSKLAFNVHLKEVHKDLYAHKCDICGNFYMSVASLQLHKKVNHPAKNSEARCAWCGAKVSHRVYLYNHTRHCKKRPVGAPKIAELGADTLPSEEVNMNPDEATADD